MEFNRSREFLGPVEFTAKNSWQHLVDSEVRNKGVLVFFEVGLNFLETYHFGDPWHFHVCDLILELSLGIFDNDAHSVIFILERVMS